MKTVLVFLSVIPPLTLGFLLVGIFWPKERRFFEDFALKCCLSVGLGFGVSSCLSFVWMAAAGQLTRGVFFAELLLIAPLGLVLMSRQRAKTSRPRLDHPQFRVPGRPHWLRIAVVIGFVSAVVQFVCYSMASPDGGWDAFAIWNLRARFLYRGGYNWTHFRIMTWSHPDYPLLVPASIAQSWEFIGQESQLVPALIAFLFTFALIGVVSLSIFQMRGERQGLLAALVLLGTPFLISHGASQYADVPLSFFFAASLSLLLLSTEKNSPPNFLLMAGVTCGLSAWTKNEGLLFVASFFFALCLAFVVFRGNDRLRISLTAWLVGCAPFLIVLVLYKVMVGVSNDVVSVHNASSVHNFLALWRFRMIASEFAKGFLEFGDWAKVFSIPVLLIFYSLLLGVKVDRRDLAAASISIALPVFMCLGYFSIYIVSPHDLKWHLDSSLNRLLLQVWPLWVIAFFTIVRSPDRALKTEPEQCIESAQVAAQ